MQFRGHVHSHNLAAQQPRYNYKFSSLSLFSGSVCFTLEEYKSTEIVDCLYPSLFSNVYPLNARNKINTWVNPEQRQYNAKKYLLGFLNQTSTSPSSKQLEVSRAVPPLLPSAFCNVAFRA